MASSVCHTDRSQARPRNECQVWHRLTLFITRLRTHVVSGAAIVSNPRDHFLRTCFVQGSLAARVDLIPKGGLCTSSASKAWEGLFVQAGNSSQKLDPPLGVVALGDLSLSSVRGLWLAQLFYYFHKNSVCIWVERTSVWVGFALFKMRIFWPIDNLFGELMKSEMWPKSKFI